MNKINNKFFDKINEYKLMKLECQFIIRLKRKYKNIKY